MQGEISVSRARLESRLVVRHGDAGTILVSVVALGTRSYAVALIVLVVFGLIGLVAALRIPAAAGGAVGEPSSAA